MKKLLGALFVVVFVLLIGTGPVWAQDASRFDDDDSFVLKVNGSATIATNESVDGVIIIRGDVVVDGTVREGLMVYDGTATINGAVGGDIVIVSGNLVLGAGSSVKDIMLVRSDITQDPQQPSTARFRKVPVISHWVGDFSSFLFSGSLAQSLPGWSPPFSSAGWAGLSSSDQWKRCDQMLWAVWSRQSSSSSYCRWPLDSLSLPLLGRRSDLVFSSSCCRFCWPWG